MTSSLAGRNAIVTGSSRGIGAQIALDLAKAGANVLLVSNRSTSLAPNLCVFANLQNYKSPSSASKVEAVMKEIRSINPSVRVGILHASVLSIC
jgi:3-oxoacyl-[acyl-carrier protein] reductase